MKKQWTAESVKRTSWFAELQTQIRASLDLLSASLVDERPALKQELQTCIQRIQGWSLSLSDPGLSPALRRRLQADLETALLEQGEFEARLRQAEAEQSKVEYDVSIADVKCPAR